MTGRKGDQVSAVEVKQLEKIYSVKHKQPGLLGSLRALWRPEYSSLTAVDRISFELAAGEAVGFVGPNGAGKSTTIKMLAGILYPSAGEARVLGLVPWRERQRLAFQIASVFGQRSQLWYHLPAADSFGLLARIYELDDRAYRSRVATLIERFEIAPYLHVPVRRLSLGERMRCEIAAALLHRPRVVFLDEPTIGLDIVAKQQIRALIRTLNQEEGVTFLLTSHDAADIEQVCKRVIVINQGTLVFDGDVDELKKRYLRHKVIDLKLSESAEPIAGPGLFLQHAEPYRIRYEVDTDVLPIERIIGQLVSLYRVSDLTVEEPPLEDVIAAIYAATGHPSAIES